MLGSAADAEDMVQEAFAALHRTEPKPDSAAAWLTTVVTRLCLDRVKSAARQRETYVGPWLPEPVPTAEDLDAMDPGERISTAESVSLAFLLVLERLSPLERAVFLLREVFDADFSEIAATLERSEAACRQLFHRAKGHVDAGRPRFAPTREAHKAIVMRFLHAVATGDLDRLKTMLTDDVQLTSDGGGKAKAALNLLDGTDRVGRFLVGVARHAEDRDVSIGWVNGELGIVQRNAAGKVTGVTVLSFGPDGQRIVRIGVIRNPDKLRSFGRQVLATA
jgi:RNA polymerase sigma-70 factor (ECF subfamily)